MKVSSFNQTNLFARERDLRLWKSQKCVNTTKLMFSDEKSVCANQNLDEEKIVIIKCAVT